MVTGAPPKRAGRTQKLRARPLLRLTIATFLALQAGSVSIACAENRSAPAWNDSVLARVEVQALLETFNADLLSHPSATLVLEDWCGTHHLSETPHVTAARDTSIRKAATAEQRKLLQVDATEPLGYRRVKLLCGGHVLSEADNWYVPGRLTKEMNRALDTTDISFGRVVQPLHFRRKTLQATLLWSPLPDHWENGASIPAAPQGGTLIIPDHVLQHHAILTLPDGTPFSEVIETYTSEVLDFPQPRLQ